MLNKNLQVNLIRHGVKERVKHTTGTEAGLDPNYTNKIKNYGIKLSNYGENFFIAAPPLKRTIDTAMILYETIWYNKKKIGINTYEERIGPFITKNAKTKCVISSDLPILWGNAEKKYQTVKGVSKEDRGMYAWSIKGLDYTDGKGITLREAGYRIGNFLFDQIDMKNQGENIDFILGVGNSGFIEPFIYSIKDMVDGISIDPIVRLQQLNGAIKPLEGIIISYRKKDPTFKMTLPNTNEKLTVEIDMLKEQSDWLTKYGIFDQIKKQILGNDEKN